MEENNIQVVKGKSCGYYFEVEKISEVPTVSNYIKKYPCCEVIILHRNSIVRFYDVNNEVEFEYKNDTGEDIQIIAYKDVLDFPTRSTDVSLYISKIIKNKEDFIKEVENIRENN